MIMSAMMSVDSVPASVVPSLMTGSTVVTAAGGGGPVKPADSEGPASTCVPPRAVRPASSRTPAAFLNLRKTGFPRVSRATDRPF